MPNNNQELIDGLRQAAEFLESRPDFPVMGQQTLRLWIFDSKSLLQEAARQLGSFTKKFTNYYFELHRPINKAIEIEVCTDRELVCKKIVTWDCPDESLLRLMTEELEPGTSGAERCAEIGKAE